MTPPPGLVAKPGQLSQWLLRQSRLPVRGSQDGIEIYYPKWFCPPKPVFGWTIGIFITAQISWAVMQAAAELRPQVILSSWLPDGLAAIRLGKQLKTPVICIADGTDVNEWPDKYPGWRYAWRYARRILNEKASALIYVSEALRLAGASRGLQPRYEAVIHNAVDVQTFTLGPKSREDGIFSILAVGRMEPVKGHSVLLEAFSELTRRLERPIRLVLVGDGPLRPALQKQASRLGIAHAVQFAGVVHPEQMPSYYQAADLFCLPSYSEGLPCVAVEAMACGRPVVASQVGGVPELVDAQSGLMVPPGDSEALCLALLQAAGQKWDAQAIRQKIVDHFSWAQWTEKIFEVIQTVMAGESVQDRAEKREKVWPAWR